MNAADTVYETSNLLVVDLLNNMGAARSAVEGFNTYRVETNTSVITYTARPVVRDGSGMPIRYAVLDAEYAPRCDRGSF